MKDNKLISMTDFVLNEYNERMDTPYNDGALVESDAYKWVRYAKFLKQALKLEMFVPCDDEGNVLEYKPNEDMHKDAGSFMAYNKAKEKVLFEGFELEGSYLMYYGFMYAMIYELGNKTIESIIDDIPNNPLQLTPTAIKQIQP